MEKNDLSWKEYCISKKSDLQKMFPDKNIDNPKTFTEKMQWLKIYDSTMIKAFCADKITLREYCKIKLGKDLCVPILKIYNSPDEINYDELPNKFVIKCNHGSEMNIIVKDKTKINKDKIKIALSKWLKIKYGDLSYELWYNLIQPKIFIEKYIENFNKSAVIDYKISCFNGEPKIFQVMTDRFTNMLHFNYYDINFNPLTDFSRNDHPARYDLKDKKPKSLDKMIEYAKVLSKDFKYVRVDFYEIEENPILGELTFTPGSGRMIYKNKETDLILGNMLSIK